MQPDFYTDEPDSDPQPEAPPPKGPWGLWATFGILLIIGAAYMAAGLLTIVPMGIASVLLDPNMDPKTFAEGLPTNGLFFAISTVLSCAFTVLIIVCFVLLRDGPSLRDYLGLRIPRTTQIFAWTIGLLAFLSLSEIVVNTADDEVNTEFMLDVYNSAVFVPLLVIAVVIAAPISEELVFRGFLFKGLRASRFGANGAIFATAAFFSSLHVQYDTAGLLVIFGLGILLGYIRERTGSLLFCIALHALVNLLATMQVAYLVREGAV